MEKISVAVRFRPPNPTGTSAAGTSGGGGDREWRIDDARVSLLHRGAPVLAASFTFDHVFDGAATNARVYGALVRSVIRAAVDGFNGTVFAYGQTSSGKTHTMSGSDVDPGIIPLAVRDLFDTACQAVDREFIFRVSYMEIYNEDINDLLTPGSQKLPIRENSEREACVGGLREDVVESAEQTLELLKLGEANRHFGETNMNVRSSRSHTIFQMAIESRAMNQMDSEHAIRVSVLNLVDLAGSERNSKTGAEGVRLEEGQHINKSLMHLGIVINKLSESGKQIGHIPYRNSKLTRILEPALGGNAKTSIICTAAPEDRTCRTRKALKIQSLKTLSSNRVGKKIHIDETKGTLQFASRAKCVSNCAQVNEILTDAALVKRQKLEIKELRKRLQGSDSEAMKQIVLKQCDDLRRIELERDQLAMELEEERKLREEERKLREALEHRLTGEKEMLEDHSKTSTSSDQFTNSIQQPTDGRCQRLEQDCRSDQQAFETELSLLKEQNSQLLLELTRSKDETNRTAAEKLEMLRELGARCPRPGKDCRADRDVAEEENNLLKEENSCLLLELSRCKQDAAHRDDEAVASCAALREERSSLAREAERVAADKLEAWSARCEALQEELAGYRQEAARVAAENRELDAAERKRRTLEEEEVAAAAREQADAVGREVLAREEQLARLLAKSKAIVARWNAAGQLQQQEQVAVP